MTPESISGKPLWIGIAGMGIAAVAAAFFLYRKQPAPPPSPPASTPTPFAVPQAGNPIEKAPDANPVRHANPFDNAYQNPFE